jgi:hypothetical protein
MLTIRYLASGDSFASLGYSFRIAKPTISKFIPEVCATIADTLARYVQTPTTTEEWLKIARNFDQKWNMPHCLGQFKSGFFYDNKVHSRKH